MSIDGFDFFHPHHPAFCMQNVLIRYVHNILIMILPFVHLFTKLFANKLYLLRGYLGTLHFFEFRHTPTHAFFTHV